LDQDTKKMKFLKKSYLKNVKLPYLLLADDNIAHRNSFVTVFEKQVAYATVTAVDDGRSLLAFLTHCGWRDLPSMIILNYQLRDTTAPDLLRELLLDTRYMKIPKVIRTHAGDAKQISECRILGVKYFLTMPDDLFELENNIRRIDELLKEELHLI
jgi:CheY-like chemotaxis protein